MALTTILEVRVSAYNCPSNSEVTCLHSLRIMWCRQQNAAVSQNLQGSSISKALQHCSTLLMLNFCQQLVMQTYGQPLF